VKLYRTEIRSAAPLNKTQQPLGVAVADLGAPLR